MCCGPGTGCLVRPGPAAQRGVGAGVSPGEEQDRSALDYPRGEVYDPATRRFTQEDPIGRAGGLNLYGFANGDPVNFSDPFGLCVPWCTAAIGAAIGGGAAALGTVWYNYLQGRSLSEGVGRNTLVGAGAGAAVGLGYGLLGAGGSATVAATAGPKIVENANKLNHLFGKVGHNLGSLVDEFGGQANAASAMQSAIQAHVSSNNLVGAFEQVVRVGSQYVTIRGRVIDGVARIGTAFIPK